MTAAEIHRDLLQLKKDFGSHWRLDLNGYRVTVNQGAHVNVSSTKPRVKAS